MKLPVCFLGFGEAGQSFCSDKRWQGEAYGCDVKLEQDDNRLAKLNDFERFGVKAIEPVDTLSNGSNLILSVVTADQALKAAERVASFLKSGTLYLDMNSAAPTTKQTAATLMHDKGIDYIDVAIMSPVIPKKLDVPLVGIAATEDTMEYYSGGGASYVSLVTVSIDNAERNLKRCGDDFKAICNEQDVAHEWFGVHGFILNEWPKLSPYVDIAFVAPPLSAPRLASAGISATMQLSEKAKIIDLSGRCMIAWDGSAQAGRALRATMPMLSRFTEVDVLLADPDTPNL